MLMGGHLNLDGGTLTLDGGTITLDGGTRPPESPLQFKYCIYGQGAQVPQFNFNNFSLSISPS